MHIHLQIAPSRFRQLCTATLPILAIIAGPVSAAETRPPQALFAEYASPYRVRLNGRLLPERFRFVRDRSGRTFVALETLRTWNVEPQKRCTAALSGQTFCALDDERALRVEFDTDTNEYAIDVLPAALPVTSVSMPWLEEVPMATRRARGAFLNYDVHAVAGGSLADGSPRGYNALFGGGITLEGGTLTTSFLAQNVTASRTRLALLDTTWQHDNVAHHATLQVGDAISSGGTFGAELRYFGIGWRSNFDTDPAFVTSPTIGLGGISSVPSVVDLYVNNALTYSKDIPAGPFEINHLPTVNGQGDVRVVVRDLLGRQQVITGSYYGTPTILGQGLSDFAVSAGFPRSNYGLANLQYGPLFVEGNLRRGITNRFTVELHAEAQAVEQEAGGIANWLIPKIGVFDAGVAINRGSFGHGNAALAGYEFAGRHWNAGTSVQLTSPGFWQLGNRANEIGSSRQTNVHIGVQNERDDSIGLAYAEQNYFDTSANRVLSLSIDHQLRHGDIEIDALRTSGVNGGLGVQLYYHLALGKRRSLNVESDHSSNFHDDMVELNVRRPTGGEGYASRLQLNSGGTNGISMQVTRYGAAGNTTVTATTAAHALAFDADLTGGLAYLDGREYLTSRLLDAFAVVHVGYPQVRVYEDGQLKGYTDRHGDLAISDLAAYDSTTLSIEPKDLPAGIIARSDSQTVVPSNRAAASVRFETERAGMVLLTVLTQQHVPLPRGTLLRANGSAVSWPVRADGTVLLAPVAPGPLRLTATDVSPQCHFTIQIPARLEQPVHLAPVSCLPVK